MTNSEECFTYVHHLLTEHHRLRVMVDGIEQMLTEGVGDQDARERAMIRVEKSLHSLRDELAYHFDEEDKGGCMEEAVCRRPELAEEASRVQSEHGELLERLDRVIDDISGIHPLDLPDAKLGASFADFREQLLRHEESESRIIEQGFNINLDLDEDK